MSGVQLESKLEHNERFRDYSFYKEKNSLNIRGLGYHDQECCDIFVWRCVVHIWVEGGIWGIRWILKRLFVEDTFK